MKTGVYEIGDFGAQGDGKTKNTSAIQAAVDKCHESGGGKVIVPSGEFLTGTIFLKDNVEFHLLSGALVKGSPDLEDYNKDDCFEQNAAFTRENVTGAHLIIAHEAKNVTISGHGTIDGNGPAFFGEIENGKFIIKDKRPGQMIYFCECEDVRIEGVTLLNVPYWTCFLHGCENVFLHGVKINNPRETRNGDGFDIDCCRNVTVSDCIIYSGDDSITLRGNNKRLKNKSRACENVVITNCILESAACGIRVGVGGGHIRNCRINNCIIRKSRTGIHIISKYAQESIGGTSIENISFSNINIDDACIALWILYGENAESYIGDINFSDINISSESGCFISGLPDRNICNVSFRNINFLMKKSDRELYGEVPPYSSNLREWSLQGKFRLPAAFYVAYAENFRFKDMTFRREGPAEESRNVFLLRNTPDIAIEEIRMGGKNVSKISDIIKRIDG